ncbi:MAG TPA: hypothetical protein VIX11_09610 [Candidatus Acidoferrum sp.]
MRPFLAFVFSLISCASVQAQWWYAQTSGIDSNLRGVAAAYTSDSKGRRAPVVWASGSNGAILKSFDRGKTWKRLHVAGGDKLDFRGIVAFDEKVVYAMSSGEGEKSRIYKTSDGGETWKLQHTHKRKEFFLDTIACVSETHCFALGDPLDGKFLLLTTTDGEHWNLLSTGNMPAALPGEGAFAASNTCLFVSGEEILFGTGGSAARVFHSGDSGRTWTVTETPIAHGNASSGIFSIARGDGKSLLIVGGDYQDPKRASAVAAYSSDDGMTWQLSEPQPGGYRSSVACIEDALCMAIGTTGEDVSISVAIETTGEYARVRNVSPAIWSPTGALNLNAMAILDFQFGWAVGPKGTIARLINQQKRIRRQPNDAPRTASPIAH